MSCRTREALPQAGQLCEAPEQLTSKSMRLAGTSSLTSSTNHGGCRPNALVNSASTPTLNSVLLAATPWTCGQTQIQPAHMPTGLDDDQRFSLLDSTRNDEGPLQCRGVHRPTVGSLFMYCCSSDKAPAVINASWLSSST